MISGRGLGHTGGTIDKLESIPGMDLRLDRARCLELLHQCGMAIGGATAGIAPADRRLYALRDVTATVDSIPLIVASILSKKLATGPAAVVFDVKTGNGAFLREPEEARTLARMLVDTARALGTPASALLTDMSQPLGQWVGHTAELMESIACLEGEGPADLVEVTLVLCEEVARLSGSPITRADLEKALAAGQAREHFDRWAALQGADPAWLRKPTFDLAPEEHPIHAPRAGKLAHVETKQLGMLLVEAGAGRSHPGSHLDHGVSLQVHARLGQEVAEGEELARLYLRTDDPSLATRCADCFTVADEGEAPPLILDRF